LTRSGSIAVAHQTIEKIAKLRRRTGHVSLHRRLIREEGTFNARAPVVAQRNKRVDIRCGARGCSGTRVHETFVSHSAIIGSNAGIVSLHDALIGIHVIRVARALKVARRDARRGGGILARGVDAALVEAALGNQNASSDSRSHRVGDSCASRHVIIPGIARAFKLIERDGRVGVGIRAGGVSVARSEGSALVDI